VCYTSAPAFKDIRIVLAESVIYKVGKGMMEDPHRIVKLGCGETIF
jgi:hypothetical protein